MLRYETLILLPTQVTADEFSMIEKFFEKVMSDAQGKLVAFDKWGKYRLSYPVRKNEYGVYLLVRYDIPEHHSMQISEKVSDFLKIKCNEVVMRYVTVRLKKDAPSIYKKPDAIDAGKPADLDTFLKENKMETFLSKNVGMENDIQEEKASSKE
jgi:ribosomal protein S6